MRIHAYILAVALSLPAAAHVSLAQQQAQRETTAAAPQSANAARDKADPKQSTAPADSHASKSSSKPAVILTNDNLNAFAASGRVPSQPAAQVPAQAGSKTTPKGITAGSNEAKEQSAVAQTPAKAKVELDPHKVLTNDDLRKLDRRGGMSVVGTDVDLSAIYDCDINCYNQVRQSAQVYPSSNLEWMRDLRAGIEKLKRDNNWRAYLGRLAALRSKVCTLADEQRTALERADNENNVTDQQIDIREEYTRKLKDVNDEVTAEYGRMNSMQANYSPLVSRFMYTQVMRIMTSNCPSSQYENRYYDPDDPNQ